MRGPLLFFASASLVAGCSPLFEAPSTTDDANDPWVHRAYTAWGPLPSTDGSRLAFALEARRVDADQHGVMVSGWKGQVVGDGVVKVVAGEGEGDVLANVPRGFLRSDASDTTLFVWSSETWEWTPEAPNDPPAPARPISVTWLDRATLAVRGTRKLDAPLEAPWAVGATTIVDTPLAGPSDVARDVRIDAYDVLDGKKQTLHRARAFAVASCPRSSGVTIAYQPETAVRKTVIVDVAFDAATGKTTAAQLEVDDLVPLHALCRAEGHHAAIVGARPGEKTARTVLVKRDGDALSIVSDANTRAVALSTDGRSVVTASGDGTAHLVTGTTSQALDGVRVKATPFISGERALFVDQGSAWLVRLDGVAPALTTIPGVAESGLERTAFATHGGAFFVFDTTPSSDKVQRAFLVEPDGRTHDVPIGFEYSHPYVAYADATRAYVFLETRDEPPGKRIPVQLVTIDLHSQAITGTSSSSLCDPETIRSANRCMP